MDRARSTHGEKRNAYKILVEKPERKRSPGIRISRWEDNIKMDLRGVGLGDMDWIYLTQVMGQCRALVYMVITFGFLKMVGNS
jgi:hypothetical protein